MEKRDDEVMKKNEIKKGDEDDEETKQGRSGLEQDELNVQNQVDRNNLISK